MDKRFLAVLAIIIIALGGIFIFSGKNDSSSGSTSAASNNITGKGASGVTLTEYGDYQCPACKNYYLAVKQAVEQMSGHIYYQFRELPLTTVHPNALASARAAEAAGLQNKYWQMHDLLYQGQDSSGQSGWVASKKPLDEYFVKYAQAIGLNVDQFKTDYASSKVNDTINADIASFKKTGQQMATPTFFIDGKYISNSEFSTQTNNGFAPSVDKIVSVINAAIAAKKQ